MCLANKAAENPNFAIEGIRRPIVIQIVDYLCISRMAWPFKFMLGTAAPRLSGPAPILTPVETEESG